VSRYLELSSLRHRSLHVVAVLIGATPLAAQRQAPADNHPARLTVESRVLGERRTVDVALPTGYASDSTNRYPLIVVLDGESEGELARTLARFYGSTGMLPKVIVAAVHNTKRIRDLTPEAANPFVSPEPEAGGADAFLSFLSTELVPRLERSYRIAPMRVLVGHSLGGLFALHGLAKRPGLFTGYVVMEPSTWWNNQQPVRDARETLRTPAARRARVMLVNAPTLSTDTSSRGGTRPMVRQIRVLDESHESMAAVGMAMALRRMFEDFRPPSWRPGTAPIAMLTHYDSLASRVGYQVPVPLEAFALIARMSTDSRRFDDAAQSLDAMERAYGATARSRELRSQLEEERRAPTPTNFIPLVIPEHRPSAAQAAGFIGRWRSVDPRDAHEVEIRASGDTVVVHDHVAYPEGPPYDADDPVIQVTKDGVLEWGMPLFKGLAALVVLKARLDGETMVVAREARGWVPRDPNFRTDRVIRYRRVIGAAD
jgi:predicted alpha/beta superfamily hydrolase